MRIKTLIFLSLILLVSFGCSFNLNSFKSEIDGVYIPKNLDDSIAELNKLLSDSTKTEIINSTEGDFLGDSHFKLGLWIRNNWGLWAGSRLNRYFNRKGIRHPDDISSIILTSYYRNINGEEIELKNQIEEYKAYWKEAKRLGKLVELPKPRKWPTDEVDYLESTWYFNEESNQQSMVHILDNSSADSVWIYDYMFGWKQIGQLIKKELKFTDNTDSLLHVIYKK